MTSLANLVQKALTRKTTVISKSNVIEYEYCLYKKKTLLAKMSGYQTTDFSTDCEVLKLCRIFYDPFRQTQHEATIFRKQNGGEAL